MFDRFTDRAKKVMSFARQEAQKFNHEYIGTEHILLGLVQEGSGVAANVLKNMDIDLEKIRHEVEKIVKTGPSMVTMGQLPFTPRAKKVLELSMEEASALSHNYIGTEHLLLGLIKENEGIAAQVLMNLNVKLQEVRAEVLEFLGASVSIQDHGSETGLGAAEKLGPGAWHIDGKLVTCRLVWTHWYSPGRKQAEGTYENGKRQGHWIFWNKDGSIDGSRTGRYEGGELIQG